MKMNRDTDKPTVYHTYNDTDVAAARALSVMGKASTREVLQLATQTGLFGLIGSVRQFVQQHAAEADIQKYTRLISLWEAYAQRIASRDTMNTDILRRIDEPFLLSQEELPF
jgi:hypothetical protein